MIKLFKVKRVDKMRGKRFFLGLCFLIGLVVLTACQNQKISNLQNQYHADGMATVVKGSTKQSRSNTALINRPGKVLRSMAELLS